MGYNTEDHVVRADRFRPSGKWHDTIALNMSGFYGIDDIHDAVRRAFAAQGGKLELGWLLVVLKPYHKNSHPVIIKW